MCQKVNDYIKQFLLPKIKRSNGIINWGKEIFLRFSPHLLIHFDIKLAVSFIFLILLQGVSKDTKFLYTWKIGQSFFDVNNFRTVHQWNFNGLHNLIINKKFNFIAFLLIMHLIIGNKNSMKYDGDPLFFRYLLHAD